MQSALSWYVEVMTVENCLPAVDFLVLQVKDSQGKNTQPAPQPSTIPHMHLSSQQHLVLCSGKIK